MADGGMSGGDPKKLFSTGGAMSYFTNVLKAQLGNSEDFLAFERSYYFQVEELNALRQTCNQLRASNSKLQEEKRTLELELVSEKVFRDQESKNATMEIEKNNVQQNAQLYSAKCEAESWKRKAEATATEVNCLKEHMRSLEMEKNQACQKLAEQKCSLSEYERYRQSLDTYIRRTNELNASSVRRMDELERAKESLALVVDHTQKQLNAMTAKLHGWNDERVQFSSKIAELEAELLKSKAEYAQNLGKMERMDMTEKQTGELIEKLMEQNTDLQTGFSILLKSTNDQISDGDQKFIEKINHLHDQIQTSVKRLL